MSKPSNMCGTQQPCACTSRKLPLCLLILIMGLRWCQMSLKQKKEAELPFAPQLLNTCTLCFQFYRDVTTPQVCCSWVMLPGTLHPLTSTRVLRPWPSLAKPSTSCTHACNTLLPLLCLRALWCLLGRKPTLSPSLLGATRRLWKGETTARVATEQNMGTETYCGRVAFSHLHDCTDKKNENKKKS